MTSIATERLAARATAAGYGAVLLWALLAALTTLAGPLPPFQLTALAFTMSTLAGVVYAWLGRHSLAVLRDVPWAAWALGIGGLLGFHICYFLALRLAPPLEASLICYLWPLLIVLFVGLLPASAGGRRLCWQHLVGAGLGFAGTVLVLLQGSRRPGFDGAAAGYACALAAALIWAGYSVALRLYRNVPSIAVIGSCAGTAAGAALMHLLLETWVWPNGTAQWLAIAGLGLGPLGLAFYLWDDGMKHGDILRLGLASYATPLLSTMVLAVLGLGVVSPILAVAAALVTLGAGIAGRA